MMKIGLIVEGDGEVKAVPILMKRILGMLAPPSYPQLLAPHRMKRGKLVREQDFKDAIEGVARSTGVNGKILVLLDADRDLPCELGPRLQGWARQQRSDRKTAVAVAQCEYEAWFLAAANSLRGKHGLPEDLTPPLFPEKIRNAKGWLAEHMPNGYRETIDQPKLTQDFSLSEARRADSFNRLLIKVGRLLDVQVPSREGLAGG